MLQDGPRFLRHEELNTRTQYGSSPTSTAIASAFVQKPSLQGAPVSLQLGFLPILCEASFEAAKYCRGSAQGDYVHVFPHEAQIPVENLRAMDECRLGEHMAA